MRSSQPLHADLQIPPFPAGVGFGSRHAADHAIDNLLMVLDRVGCDQLASGHERTGVRQQRMALA